MQSKLLAVRKVFAICDAPVKSFPKSTTLPRRDRGVRTGGETISPQMLTTAERGKMAASLSTAMRGRPRRREWIFRL
eukprot:5048076-Pleurochrysis_carterae.AAC.1